VLIDDVTQVTRPWIVILCFLSSTSTSRTHTETPLDPITSRIQLEDLRISVCRSRAHAHADYRSRGHTFVKMYASSDVEMTSEAIIAGAVSSSMLSTAITDDVAGFSTSKCPATASTLSEIVPLILRTSQLARLTAGLDNLVPASSEPAEAILDTATMFKGTMVKTALCPCG
jgi:hypothetical protein